VRETTDGECTIKFFGFRRETKGWPFFLRGGDGRGVALGSCAEGGGRRAW
jgi:hypothetical protein